ncbi:hypothetical protein V1512DRAFT_260749 [Lipomyces arxii]|uniref:uncharacterized protein n=1 Tax=Lipomyces arxii TaxID=56418 RepID=UPI0034CEF434
MSSMARTSILRASSLRQFSSSTTRSNTAAAPVIGVKTRKPVGAFRGGLFGFLLGSTLTGALGYYYVLDVYRDSNSLLLEDLLHLQRHVSKIEDHMKSQESK